MEKISSLEDTNDSDADLAKRLATEEQHEFLKNQEKVGNVLSVGFFFFFLS